MRPRCEFCNKEKTVEYQGNGIQYPIYSCPEHGPDERNEWELWWIKYHDRFKSKEYWKSSKDRPSCVVGYFCNEYQKFYGFTYVLDYGSPIPYTNKEFKAARKILTMFGDDFMMVPDYIKWVFAKRVKNTKKTITSFGFFATPDFANSYKAARARSVVLKRSTGLPTDFLEWCRSNHSDIFDKQELNTWNDLNGLVTHVKCYGTDNTEGLVVQEAISRGLLSGMEHKKLED